MTTTLAERVFSSFLDMVVNHHALAERTGSLSDRVAADIAAGKRIDTRTPRLLSISGKGGYVATPAFEARRRFRNVTLLDHVVSVARGACVIAEIDLRAAGVNNDDALGARLAVVVTLGFLHDADKMLELNRVQSVTSEHVEDLVARYGLSAFLAEHGATASAERLRALIDAVEVSRGGRLVPGSVVLRADERNDTRYVRLADRLDGTFLDSHRGAESVVADLAAAGDMLRTDALLAEWRTECIVSVHTPFLLDLFQQAFERECREHTGMPPLISVHQDGVLTLVAPGSAFGAAFEAALERFSARFATGLRTSVNPRGSRDLLDGGSGVEDLRTFLLRTSAEARKLLFVHVDVAKVEGFREHFDSRFDAVGFGAIWAGLDAFSGQHFTPWPVPADDAAPDYAETFVSAATVVAALGAREPKDKSVARAVPNAAEREAELSALLDDYAPVPDWITEIEHRSTRQTLLAAHAGAAAVADPALAAALFDTGGLVDLWLAGDGSERRGLLDAIDDPGRKLAEAACDWLRRGVSRRFVPPPEDESATGRCLFTAAPVGPNGKIDSNTGLYGVKVTAFSGREGRPETFETTRQETLVSPVAMAEHRLRRIENPSAPAGAAMPVLISSPTNAGLFASLNQSSDHAAESFGLHDMARAKLASGNRVFRVEERRYQRRAAIGRYEVFPTRTASSAGNPGIITFVRMTCEAALRAGRPVHVFRGCPEPRLGFVTFDTLPEALAVMFDAEGFAMESPGDAGASLRLEQLPRAIHLLSLVETVADTTGLGVEIAMRLADPSTRFAAGAEAILRLERRDPDATQTALRRDLETLIWEEITMTQPTDDAIIAFARCMTRVQRAPLGRDSNAVKDLGMHTALDAVEAAHRIGQTGSHSLRDAVASAIETEFERSTQNLRAAAVQRDDTPLPTAIAEAAGVFVDRVWPEAFHSKPPARRDRRIATGIYRAAFLRLSQEARAAPIAKADPA